MFLSHIFLKCIQGVPRGKVNILGGHSIVHSKQKILCDITPENLKSGARAEIHY
jgi:hypothetical protein